MSHVADWAYGPQFAILAEFQSSLIPDAVVEKLNNFQGEHTFSSSAYSPPYDTYPRNITAWLANDISIGAEAFNETVVGGPAINPDTFNPAIIQWNTGEEIGYITVRSLTQHFSNSLLMKMQWYATEHALTAVASANNLNLTYPYGTADSIFSIIVGTFHKKRDVASWEDVQGLTVKVTGNVNMSSLSIGYAGEYGGLYSDIK
jgi:hypothetical protein